MTQALHLVSVQRGYDPREFALVAFGGAGPLHANALAAELHIPTTMLPPSPGLTSALGLLATDLTHDYVRTIRRRTALLDLSRVATAFQSLEAEGRTLLLREGVDTANVQFRYALEMRYVGQSFELTIDVPRSDLTLADLIQAEASFHLAHERAYGFAAPGEPTEIMNIRFTAIGSIPKPRLRTLRPRATGDAKRGSRPVHLTPTDSAECPIYDRYRLAVGARIEGPALVDELDSTTFVQRGYQATVDALDNLVLTPHA
jgi:N-methylhydantoinase A